MCLPRLHNDGKCKKFLNRVYYFAFFSLITLSYLGFFLISFFYGEVALSSCRTVSTPHFLLSYYQKTLSETVQLCCPDFVCNALHAGSLSQTFSKARSLRIYRIEDIKFFHEWYYVLHKYIILIWTNESLFYIKEDCINSCFVWVKLPFVSRMFRQSCRGSECNRPNL